jgi:hypothetical protein
LENPTTQRILPPAVDVFWTNKDNPRRPALPVLIVAGPRPDGWLLPFELQQHSWPAPSVLWKLFEYGHTFLCLGPGTGCVHGAALMVHDLPDSIVLDEPDFLGLVVVLLFLVHKMERIRKWFTIDSNFKRPILNRTDRTRTTRPKSRCVTVLRFSHGSTEYEGNQGIISI